MTAPEPELGCAHDARAARPRNRPGLARIEHGIGNHPELLRAMLAQLSRDPNLGHLTTRATDDPAVSLIDAWAMVLDILSFYQSRIANEGWLRCATERRSVQELARMVGYELNPGVAAQTLQAFSVQETPGGGQVYPMPEGMKVQSIPGPGEQPQIFETAQTLQARAEWNALRPRRTVPQTISRRSTSTWLAGVETGLDPGDMILLVGAARAADPGSERWDLRQITAVRPDPAAGCTQVFWREDLGHSAPATEPAADPQIFGFATRAGIFGHNAPDFRAMPAELRRAYGAANASEWPGFTITTAAQRRIDLDREYDGILPGSWVVLDQGGVRELYRVQRTATLARTDFTLTGRVTSLILDTDESLGLFGLRGTAVLAGSRRLDRAEAPVAAPVSGASITLEGGSHPALAAGQSLILRGRKVQAMAVAPRAHVFRQGAGTVEAADAPLIFMPDDGGAALTLADGTRLAVLGAPETDAAGNTVWPLALPDGRAGTVTGSAGEDLLPLPPEPPEDAFAPPDEALYDSEAVLIRQIHRTGGAATLTLEQPLAGIYWRPSVTLNGNVVAASHGQTRVELTSALTGDSFTETLGSGDAGRVMQSFRLSQKPLTFTQSSSASGGTTSLLVRVDGLAWTEVETLYRQPGDARVYATRLEADGRMRVEFGDGRFGARLPAGQGNVTATYRVGIGLAGQVRAGQLSLPMDQPLGLQSVTNPLPATGAQDPERIEDARQNAPLTVLTMDRVVSLRDHEDFARAFAGIGKAQASAIWSGQRRIVHITAIGADGSTLDPAGTTLGNLGAAIDGARHVGQPIVLDGHAERQFGMRMQAGVVPGLSPAPVLGALRAALLARYGLQGQALAESVEASHVMATAQAVPGVAAVILTRLDGQHPVKRSRLVARRARWSASDGAFLPAELLLIDPDRLEIEEISP